MAYKIKAKKEIWENRMINIGEIKNPVGWKEIDKNHYSHKFGKTEIFKETKYKNKGLWRVHTEFPEYHKKLTSKGFESRTDAINFAKGYLIKFPYG